MAKRKIILINRNFQLRFSFYVCSWLIILSFIYPLIIFNLIDYFFRYLASDPMGPALAVLENTRQQIIGLLVLMQGVFLTLAFGISIFMSHKVAGPLYKLNQYFQEAMNGNLEQKLSFRKKDYFTELVPSYNAMMDAIRNRIEKKKNAIAITAQKLEALLSRSSPEVREELKEILSDLMEAQEK
jgi:methyl-accepting chemotaxis protein